MGDLFTFTISNLSAFEEQKNMYISNLFYDGKYQPTYKECVDKIYKNKRDDNDAIKDANGDKNIINLMLNKKYRIGKLISIRPTEHINLDKDISKKIYEYIKKHGAEGLMKYFPDPEGCYEFVVTNDRQPEVHISTNTFSYIFYLFVECKNQDEYDILRKDSFTIHLVNYKSKDNKKDYDIILSVSEKELYGQ